VRRDELTPSILATTTLRKKQTEIKNILDQAMFPESHSEKMKISKPWSQLNFDN
jgi:hypothetical protein